MPDELSIPPSPKKASPRRKPSKKAATPSDSLPDFGVVRAEMVPRKRFESTMFMRGIMVILLAVVIIGAVYLVAVTTKRQARTASNQQQIHAVFLNNGQVFFGTIEQEDSKNVTLANVYYVQMVQEQLPAEEGKEPQTVQKPQLVRKGDEFYGPSNTIRINRDQITVIEQLRSDSDIIKEINRLKQ